MEKDLEIAVIGAGPAGLSAALAAAQMGAQVTLLDAYPTPGGQYYRQPPGYLAGQPTRRQQEGRELWKRVAGMGVTILSETQVWDANADKTLFVHRPEGTGTLYARAIILAIGAYERPAAFPGWTLPGVIMTGGAQTLLYQGVLPGRKVLLAGSGPLQLLVAKKLLTAGAEVVAVLESSARLVQRGLRHLDGVWGQWERLAEGFSSMLALLRKGVPYRLGWGIVAALGKDQVEGAIIARNDEDWRPLPGSEREIACDTLCIGFGFLPFNTLGLVMGARHVWDAALNAATPVRDATMQTSLQGVYAVGDGAGLGGARLSQLEGRVAGIAAAAQLGYGKAAAEAALEKLAKPLQRERRFQCMYNDLFTPGAGLYELARDDTPLCRCEGATLRDLHRAVEMGADTLAEVKAITRAGMGECQGRICAAQVNTLIARLTGRTPSDVGINTPRPPVFPLPIQSLILEDRA